MEKPEVNEIVQKYELQLLLLFGSYCNGRFTESSDIDVAYLSKIDLTLDQEISLLNDLIKYFRRDRVDLVNLAKAVPLLMYGIACNSKLIYEENNSFLRFKLKASARYADTKFLREARRKYLDEQLRVK